MTALASTETRNADQYAFGAIPSLIFNLPVAASVNCRAGGIACVALTGADAGFAKPAIGSTTQIQVLGRFEESFNNSAGSNGGTSTDAPEGRTYIQIASGAFWFKNSSSTDAIAAANRYGDCYVVDDQTVALTDGGGVRARAGIVLGVDSTKGVLVLMGPAFNSAPNARNPKIQVVSPGAGTTLASGVKAVGGVSGTFSLTASSQIIPIHTSANSSTALGAQYVISSITTGAPGTAVFTVTATAAGATTATGDTSILAFVIVG